MSPLTWGLLAVLSIVIVVGLAEGTSAFAIAAVLAIISGWLAVASYAKRDIDRRGGDGEHVGLTIMAFGWLGLAYWVVARRRDASKT